jgi:hypothetical protein
MATTSRSAHGHNVPVVEIRYSGLSHVVDVSVAEQTPTNLFMQVAGGIVQLGRKLTCQNRSDKLRLGVLRVGGGRCDTSGLEELACASVISCRA